MHLDACIKCGACTAQCPVAAVYPLFPGPKSVGPDAERLRLEGIALAPGCLAYCTNCKTCEVTCPSGVCITDMILQVRRQEQEAGTGKAICRLGMRDHLLGRAEYLGRLGTLWPPLANTVLGWKITRRLLEKTLGISARAPLPRYGRKFRTSDIAPVVGKTQSHGETESYGETERYGQSEEHGRGKTEHGCRKTEPSDRVKTDRKGRSTQKVVYFPGCFISYNDEATGQAVVKVLEHNGFEVIVPGFHCCGVPLTANGRFREATANAQHNLGLMQPYLEQGIPVIASCTSCGLALKEDYPRVSAPGAQRIGAQTYDLFEFLWVLHERGELRKDFREVQASLAYHAPCHLKAQGIGTPSVRILRLIPGVKIQELDAGCCGLSGSFAFKAEKYELSLQIGSTLFQRVQGGVKEKAFQAVATECGGCQVQIEHGSGAPSLNPVWVLYQAYGLGISSAIG